MTGGGEGFGPSRRARKRTWWQRGYRPGLPTAEATTRTKHPHVGGAQPNPSSALTSSRSRLSIVSGRRSRPRWPAAGWMCGATSRSAPPGADLPRRHQSHKPGASGVRRNGEQVGVGFCSGRVIGRECPGRPAATLESTSLRVPASSTSLEPADRFWSARKRRLTAERAPLADVRRPGSARVCVPDRIRPGLSTSNAPRMGLRSGPAAGRRCRCRSWCAGSASRS